MGPEPYQGVVEYEERVVGFEVGGRLVSVTVERGAEVRVDSAIAALDDSLERLGREARAAEVRAAEAQVALLREGPRGEEVRAVNAQVRAARAAEDLARRNVERVTGLTARGASASTQVDEVQARLDQATAQRTSLESQLRALRDGARTQEIEMGEARLAAARAGLGLVDERLARYTLRAGLDATALEVHVEPGEVVAPGAPVVTLADVRHPFVDVFVPEAAVPGVRERAAATIRVDGLDAPLRGHVEVIGRRTEFTPRFLFSERERPNLVVRVRVRIDDPDGLVRAGLPAFVTIEGASS